jgi:hypothetical protein
MPSILDIVDAKSRVPHDKLRDLIAGLSLSEFTEQAKHPFLIGKELYDGELRKKIGGGPSSGTLKFNAYEVKNAVEEYAKNKRAMTETFQDADPAPRAQDNASSGMSNAVYMIRKKMYSSEPDQNTFTIGRSADNDIVIADFVVSKIHAHIVVFHEMYFIVDMNSTNGTRVNGKLIPPKMKVQLQLNSSIAFGRLCFMLTHPLQVYRGLRREIMGY